MGAQANLPMAISSPENITTKIDYPETYEAEDKVIVTKAKKRQALWNLGAKVVAAPFAAGTITTVTIIGTIGTAFIFPSLPLWSLIGLTIAGFIVDTIFYTHDTLASFKAIFAVGLLNDLEDHVLIRELTEPGEKIKEAKLEALRKENNNKHKEIKAKIKEIEEKIANCKKNSKLEKIQKDILLEALQKELSNQYKEINTLKKAYKKRQKKQKKELEASEKVAKSYLRAWQFSRKKELMNQKKASLLPGNTSAEAKRKIKAGVKNECQKSNRLLDKVGLQITKIKKRCRGEIVFKKILIVIGVVLAVINGIGWGSMAFTHVLPLLSAITLPGLFTMPALLLPILAGIAAVITGVAMFMMLYQTVSSAVKKNIFRKIWNKLAVEREPQWDGELPPLWLHCLKWILKLIPVLIILTIAALISALTVGALLDATVQAAALILHYSDKVIEFTIKAMMLIALPFSILFSLQHSVGAFSKSVKLFRDTIFSKKAITKIYNEVKRNPLMALVYGTVFVIAGGAFFVHLVASAASTAGEGAAGLTGAVGNFFKAASKLFGLKPTIFATITATITEGLEHLDFVLRDTKEGVDTAYDFCESTYARLKAWWKGEKPIEEKKPSEKVVTPGHRFFAKSILGEPERDRAFIQASLSSLAEEYDARVRIKHEFFPTDLFKRGFSASQKKTAVQAMKKVLSANDMSSAKQAFDEIQDDTLAACSNGRLGDVFQQLKSLF